MLERSLTYKDTGVDYDAMDPFKRMAQRAAQKTDVNLPPGFEAVTRSRGESAFLIKTPPCISGLAHVQEGLGTKNLIADAMVALTGKSYYDQIAQDTVAMIVNDLITLGAHPLAVAMHIAAGSSDWFKDEKRLHDLVNGWVRACTLAGCVWSGGESPTLPEIVSPDTVELSGSAVGYYSMEEQALDGAAIRGGDRIILIGSSGLHANGATLARKIAKKLPDGYLTKLSDGRTYGESLLDPTLIYAPLIELCRIKQLEIRYAVNITGHGWRKLMRAQEPFRYVIEHIPEPQPVFRLMQEHVSLRECYGNLNMGAGFAIFVAPYSSQSDKVVHAARNCGFTAIHAGYVEKAENRQVVITPLDITFEEDDLKVR